MAFQLRQGWKIPGRDIGWLETVAVEPITHIFDAWDLQSMRVVIHSDNQGTIGAMGKGRSLNYHINMSLRRCYSILTPCLIIPSLIPSLIYIDSASNPTDPLSRGILGPDEFCISIRPSLPKVLLDAFEQR
jgi:hypothetical protein